ncbi:MAG: GntR family transcriptional regulator [Alphaproteobacteria bacterium]|nr:GntR family transcriptional regulator [Alphaproteobacteria bacterium]
MAKSHASAGRLAALVGRVRNDIKFGGFEPGAWLKLIDLQRRYAATQFEIRQVLAELRGQRLVEHRANHGFRVAVQDMVERDRLYFVRAVLERSAGPLVVANAGAADVAALERLADAFDRTVGSDGRHRQAAANGAFHDRFFAIAGNPVLVETIQGLRERSHFGTTGRWRTEEGLKASGAEHHAMVDAIRRRDVESLDRIVAGHIAAF